MERCLFKKVFFPTRKFSIRYEPTCIPFFFNWIWIPFNMFEILRIWIQLKLDLIQFNSSCIWHLSFNIFIWFEFNLVSTKLIHFFDTYNFFLFQFCDVSVMVIIHISLYPSQNNMILVCCSTLATLTLNTLFVRMLKFQLVINYGVQYSQTPRLSSP
jgi:hypothetical protein